MAGPLCITQLVIISICILRDLLQGKNPRVLVPPILYVPMFPWKYLFSSKAEKKQGNKKRVVYGRGGSCIGEPPLQLTLRNCTRSLHHSQIQL